MDTSTGPIAIDLSQKLDVDVARVRALPSGREVLFAGEIETLEPRVMQVVVALARKRGQVLSRGQLVVNECWEGRIVGEDAIQRSKKARSGNLRESQTSQVSGCQSTRGSLWRQRAITVLAPAFYRTIRLHPRRACCAAPRSDRRRTESIPSDRPAHPVDRTVVAELSRTDVCDRSVR